MIQIDIVDYDNLSSLGMRITKYVNSNLRDIVRVLIDRIIPAHTGQMNRTISFARAIQVHPREYGADP